MHEVSLYLPCYNVAEFLPRVIAGVMAQTYPIAEVILIDDGSRDNTVQVAQASMVQARYPLRIVQQPHNMGLAAARNRGIQESNTAFVAAIDADCVADPEWLAKLMAHFTHDNVAGVGGRLIETVFKTDADYWRDAHMRQDWGEKRMENPSFLYGHGNVYRKAALLEVGGYDTQYKTNAEDYHLSVALYKAGYTLIYEPEAILQHLKYDTTESVLRAYWRYHYEWQTKKYVDYIISESQKTKVHKLGRVAITAWKAYYLLPFLRKNLLAYRHRAKSLHHLDQQTHTHSLAALNQRMPKLAHHFDWQMIKKAIFS